MPEGPPSLENETRTVDSELLCHAINGVLEAEHSKNPEPEGLAGKLLDLIDSYQIRERELQTSLGAYAHKEGTESMGNPAFYRVLGGVGGRSWP